MYTDISLDTYREAHLKTKFNIWREFRWGVQEVFNLGQLDLVVDR